MKYLNLKEKFTYIEGVLYWKIRPSNNVNIGDVAGNSRADGYREVKIETVKYLLHRVIFFMNHGYLPEFIDHIDGDKSNNKIENLRECTNGQNQHNRVIGINNKSGSKGVHWNKMNKKWQAYITTKGKTFKGVRISKSKS